ncbi:MAG TPA: class I SAM-dependent methyltransferase [Candidatus Aquicultor sp.]
MSNKEPGTGEVLLTLALEPIVAPLYKQYIQSLMLKGNECVLDFGAGSGVAGRYLAPNLLMDGGHLTCADVSDAWTKTAKRRLQHYPNVDFMLGDVIQGTLQGRSFDAIVIHFVLHDIEPQLRAETVRALSQTLADNGAIYIREPMSDTHGIIADEVKSIMARAGLHEISSSISHTRLFGDVFTGMFTKPE